MNTPQIVGIHTDVPKNRYQQAEIADFYIEMVPSATNRRHRAIRAIFDAAGVSHRHSVVDADFYRQSRTTRQRNDRYMQEALDLGKHVVRQGLECAGIAPHEITDFVVVSCTGFSIPGLDLLIAHDLGMRAQLNRACVLGMGCYGAFPGIRLAWDSIKAHTDGLALVLSVELCTLHFQFDSSVETVVSTSLFADGAAMLVIGSQRTPSSGPTLIDHEAYCDYKTLDDMSFTVTDEGFYMYLSSYVPDILKANIENFVDRLLTRNHLQRKDVKFWAIHPGSKKIVQHIQRQLDLTDSQVQNSLDILENNGNMSSATVLFVLNCIIQSQAPQPGDYGIMMAFGPGLTMESLLIRW